MEQLKSKAIKIVQKFIMTSQKLREKKFEEAASQYYREAVNACAAYTILFEDSKTFYDLLT